MVDSSTIPRLTKIVMIRDRNKEVISGLMMYYDGLIHPINIMPNKVRKKLKANRGDFEKKKFKFKPDVHITKVKAQYESNKKEYLVQLTLMTNKGKSITIGRNPNSYEDFSMEMIAKDMKNPRLICFSGVCNKERIVNLEGHFVCLEAMSAGNASLIELFS